MIGAMGKRVKLSPLIHRDEALPGSFLLYISENVWRFSFKNNLVTSAQGW